jgi:hypothetical protein
VIYNPAGPYMIALGTSHTAGICDTYTIQDTFADKIARELNLELIKIGIPGCINEELSYAFLRLQNSGLLENENLKFFLLEPRLTETSMRIGIDSFFNVNDATEILETYIKKSIGYTAIKDKYKDEFIRPYRLVAEYFSFVMNDKSSVDDKVNNILQLINNRTNKEYEVDPDIKRIIEDYVNYSLHYAESYAELFNNMIHISMILNTLNLIEVPTAWITFDEMYRNKLRGIDRNLLITGYFKNTKDTLITDGICNKYMNNSPHLLCDCGHLNSAGHDSLYTEIIDKIKDIVDFK